MGYKRGYYRRKNVARVGECQYRRRGREKKGKESDKKGSVNGKKWCLEKEEEREREMKIHRTKH